MIAPSRIFNIKWTIDGLGIFALILMPLISLLNPVDLFEVGGLSIRAVDLLFIFISTLVSIRVFLLVTLPSNFIATFLMLFCFGVLTMLGYLLSHDYQVVYSNFFRFLQGIIWALFASVFVTERRYSKAILYAFFIAGTVIAIFSVWLVFMVPGLHRIAGWFSFAGGEGVVGQASYNEIGAIHALVVAICFFLFLNKLRVGALESIFLIVVACSNLIGLVLTQSRSSLLALCVVIIFVFSKPMTRAVVSLKINKSFIVFFFVMLSSAVLFTFTVFNYYSRLSSSFVPGSNAFSSAMERIGLWQMGVDLWLEGPLSFLFGHGYGSLLSLTGVASAHNFFINILVSMGLLGLFVVFAVLTIPLFLVFKSKDRRGLAFLVLAVAVIVSMTGNVLVDPFYGGVTYLLSYAFLAAPPYSNS